MNAIAKLKMTEEGLTLVFPASVSFPSDTVEIRRQGDEVVLAPVNKKRPLSKEEIDAWFASMDAHRPPPGEPDDFMADREQPPMIPKPS